LSASSKILVSSALAALLGLAGLGPGCAGGPTQDQVQRSQREYDLGVGLWGERNLPGAFEHVLRAVELDPDNAEAHLFLGNLFMINRHDYARAEHHFREAVRANQVAQVRAGLEADARNSLGVLFIHAGRHEDAATVLREAASDLMNREPAVSWTNLGWAYLELGRHDQALEVLGQAVQLSPQLCMAWYRIGQVRVSREQWSEAEEALDRALEVENETCARLQVAWRLRGEVRARLGHREEAIGDLERCVELSSDTEDGRACRRLLASSPAPDLGDHGN
jgi:tetratricopeptide (TPR) repeat protein